MASISAMKTSRAAITSFYSSVRLEPVFLMALILARASST